MGKGHLDPGDLLAHQGTRSGPSRRPRRTRCPPARLRPERTATKGSSLATCHGRCAMGDHEIFGINIIYKIHKQLQPCVVYITPWDIS